MGHSNCENILIIGSGKLASGVVFNLLQSGETVYFLSENAAEDGQYIKDYMSDWSRYKSEEIDTKRLFYIPSIEQSPVCDLAIVITAEELPLKQQWLLALDQKLPAETIIAINTESFLLNSLQAHTPHPERIIGLNWCEPAYATSFLEIITNDTTAPAVSQHIEQVARGRWHKDPCVVSCGYSVNARMMAALAREAFYLVEQGYASVADIDRACRNDAGYYLPFAGNCRYMDLMGTYAYGMVMEDLNRELSKEDHLPDFFSNLVENDNNGMEAGQGFYTYTAGEKSEWENTVRRFSLEVKKIIDKYPFAYLQEDAKKNHPKIILND